MENEQHLLPSGLSRLVERGTLWMIILLLVLSNLLTVVSSSFQHSMYDLLSHIPVDGFLTNSLVSNKNLLELEKQHLQKQVHQMNSKWEYHRAKTKVLSKNIVKRLVANATRNMSSVFGEAVPYFGTALVISVTAADITDACDTIVDMNELTQSLEGETYRADQSAVCGIKIPSSEDVLGSVKQQLGTSLNQVEEQSRASARNLYNSIGSTLYQLLNK